MPHPESEQVQRRSAGSLTVSRIGTEEVGQKKWLVLTESTQDPQTKYWTHQQCGGEIQAKEVFLSVHDGPFPLSGHGEVRHVQVPYCPNCENEPSRFGSIDTQGTYIP